MLSPIKNYILNKWNSTRKNATAGRSGKGLVRHMLFEETRPEGDNWRITILNSILYGAFILSILSAAAGSNNQIRDGRYLYVIFYAACVLVIGAAAFLKSLRHKIRASVLLIIFYLVAMSELSVSGITGDGDHFMTAMVVLAGILINVRAGFAVFFITTLSMVFMAYLIVGGFIRLEPFLGEVSYRTRNWASAITAYVFMTATMFISIVFMQKKMEQTIGEREKSIRELTRENRIRKKREQSLNIFKQLLTTSYDSIAYIDHKNRIKTANDAFNDLFGFGKNKKTMGGWGGDDSSGKALAANLKRAQRGETMLFEHRVIDGAGKERHMEILLNPFSGKGHGLRGIVFIARDITDKIKMEHDLIEMNEEGYRTFSMALHDGLSHYLLEVAFHCNQFTRRLVKKDPALARQAGEIEGQVNQAIALTRNISGGLFPLTLKTMSLREMMEQKKKLLEESFRKQCTLEADPGLHMTSRTGAMHVHYIMQEAVINIIKHAGASRVWISLKESRNHYDLLIADNGEGIESPGGTGTGRRIMEYRARKIGGSLSITGGQGKRTEVLCKIPLSLVEVR